MSDTIAQPAGQRVLALRESYLAICEGDACAALLLNAAERWYTYKLRLRDESRGRNAAARRNHEPADADESLWVRRSAPEWRDDLLGVYGDKTVLDRLSRLKALGFLTSRAHPRYKWDKTPQWMFNRAAVQAAVDAWAAGRTLTHLDPQNEDEETPENAVFSEAVKVPRRVGKNGGMNGAKVPRRDGASAASAAQIYRSNNTDILNRYLKQNKNNEPLAADAAWLENPQTCQTPEPQPQSEGDALSGEVSQAPQEAGVTPAPSPQKIPGGAAGAKPKPGREPSEFQRMFGAVAFACLGTADDLTNAARGRVGNATKSLLAAKFTPDDIPVIAAWIRHKDPWRTDLSPTTLEGEAPKWRAQQAQTAPSAAPAPGPGGTMQTDLDALFVGRATPGHPDYDPRFDFDHPDYDPEMVMREMKRARQEMKNHDQQ